jgi:prepilin-type N-terminal cleavage/methylation domain-containing protein
MISNQNNKNKKAFTLVELAIVLLVIGILAGIVLRNMGGFTVQARDARRIADLRNTAIYLQAYFSRFGGYPTTASWTGLERTLADAKIVNNLPKDPAGGNYYYYSCKKNADDTSFNVAILKAVLETATSENPELYRQSLSSTSGISTCTPDSDNNNPYTNSSVCFGTTTFCLAL